MGEVDLNVSPENGEPEKVMKGCGNSSSAS
jgi:hypothetical protein